MKYSKCQNYFDIYTKTDSVSMLVMKSPVSDTIIGRALLWDFNCECGECECGEVKKVMDRIYTTQDDEYQVFFKKWADKNGYIYKTNQNWASTLQFDTNFVTSEHRFGIKVNLKDIDRYPYLDTFKWLDVNASILYNYRPEYFINDIDTFRLLASPDGRYTEIDYIKFDNIDRDWDYPANLVCYDGENYTGSDNCHYSETLDRYILRSESEYNEDLRDYIYTDLSRVDSNILEKRRSLFTSKKENEIKDRYTPFNWNIGTSFTDRERWDRFIYDGDQIGEVLQMLGRSNTL
jgi:hypothetical protein